MEVLRFQRILSQQQCIKEEEGQQECVTRSGPHEQSHVSGVMTTMNRSLIAWTVLPALIIAVYSNSLHGEFSFDDNFAIVYNGDAASDTPIEHVFKNDFWGQDITSESSHKSYRPLTVLSYRLNHWLYCLAKDHFPDSLLLRYIVNGDTSPVTQRADQQKHSDKEDWTFVPKTDTEREEAYGPVKRHSVKDHIHTLSHLIDEQEGGRGVSLYEVSPFSYHVVNVILHTIVTMLLYHFLCHCLSDRLPHAATAPQAVAFAAALLFAVHPVHTEAVSGLVGRAEMLCAIFYLLSLHCYSYAVRSPTVTVAGAGMFMLALLCVWLSTLSKESGFTVVGLLVVYDFFIAPDENSDIFGRSLRGWGNILFRCIMVALTAVGYLKFRSWLTVHFTVLIYRQLENPIAFVENLHLRFLSNIFVHFRYFWLLLCPASLSADWSFNCIPMIDSVTDVRNLLSISFYFAVFASLLLLFIRILTQQFMPSSNSILSSHRMCVFLICFVIFPFVPASNFFLYVGTLIGERLLYLPSAGFCCLLPLVLDFFVHRHSLILHADERCNNDERNVEAKEWHCQVVTAGTKRQVIKQRIAVATIVVLTAYYSYGTYVRNNDWASEEKLFLSAMRVCPTSAKVQQNVGILYRRYGYYARAVECFQRSLDIWPAYCETHQWIGSTELFRNNQRSGIHHLTEGMFCDKTAVKCTLILQAIYQEKRQNFPTDPSHWVEWGITLLRANMTNEGGDLMISAAQLWQQAASDETYETAINYLERAISHISDKSHRAYPLLLVWKGTLNMQASNTLQAAKDMEKAASSGLSPDDEIVDLASKGILNLLEMDTSNAQIQELWGRVLWNVHKQYAISARHYQAAAVLYMQQLSVTRDVDKALVNGATRTLKKLQDFDNRIVSDEIKDTAERNLRHILETFK